MNTALTHAKDQLTALGPQRVWSLLVTVFGDLAQSPGDGIEGPVLSALMQDLNIRPEALRVALHRLRNDDWITSAKTGRTSLHSLTPRGRAESAKASPRIYNRPDEMPQGWQVVLAENNSAESRAAYADNGFAPLMPRVFLGPAGTKAPGKGLALPANDVPGWVRSQFEPEALAKDYAALHEALTLLNAALPAVHGLGARDVAVLRCVIVHSWRRLVLRHPALPRSLYSAAWRGHDCRTLVTDLLGRLRKPDLADI